MIQRLRHIISVFLPATLIVISATICATASNEAGKSDFIGEPLFQRVEWLGVEVVTDRPKVGSDIRGKIPLPTRTTLDFPSEDVGYKQWCDAVRAA